MDDADAVVQGAGDYPGGFTELFEPRFIADADADADAHIRGTLASPAIDLVHRVHLLACPEPGVITVCGSQEGWRFLPGGRLEPDEPVGGAIRRELLEEAGADTGRSAPVLLQPHRTSRRPEPYMPHVPHPVMWWADAITRSRVVSAPTSPPGGEQITEVHHLPTDDAISWLAEDDPIHADVVRLAAHLELI